MSKSNTPLTDAYRARIPEPIAVQELLVSHANLESALREIITQLGAEHPLLDWCEHVARKALLGIQ